VKQKAKRGCWLIWTSANGNRHATLPEEFYGT
jgi:hypothetical protein